jgi:magnesium chelatase subunit I
VKDVFDRRYDVNDLEPIAMAFNDGLTVDTGEVAPAEDYATITEKVPALNDIFPDRDSVSDTMRATVIEFVLEGLHLHKLLNKFDHAGTATYTG